MKPDLTDEETHALARLFCDTSMTSHHSLSTVLSVSARRCGKSVLDAAYEICGLPPDDRTAFMCVVEETTSQNPDPSNSAAFASPARCQVDYGPFWTPEKPG
jgi:hypothetical protein